MEGNPWFLVFGAAIGAIPGVLAYWLGRRKYADEQAHQQAVSAISGFVDLVKALEERVDRSHEEIEHAEVALTKCRGELERMRRTLLAFEAGGIIEEDK